MEVSTYLGFNGTCEEAFKFYEKVLGGKMEAMMTYGSSPMASQTPPEMQDKIMHVRMLIDKQALMGGDAPPQNFKPAQGFNVCLSPKDPAEAERIFNELSKDGKITMPMQKTFWAERFGMAVDRFGTPWIINCAPAA